MATNSWYKSLLQNINNLAEELGLDDFAGGKLRDFVLDTAKAEFKAGNKSGIAWAFKQSRAKEVPTAAQAA